MNGFTRLKKWIFIAFVFVIGTVFLIECGGGGGGDSDGSNAPPQNIPNITFEKESGSAGSIVKVFGIDIESCPVSNSEIKIGGEIAPALLNDKGELLMMLPLYYDEGTKWPAPPIGAQNVEIYCDDKLLTTLPEAMTITELNPAPGTTELLIADYSQIVSDFKYITSMMAPIPGLQQQLFDALLSAMQAFLDGNSANSLPTMINEIKQDDPEFLALLDAIHAASGAYENIDSFKKLMTGLKSDVSAAASMVSNNEPVSLSSYEITSPVTQFTHARTTMSATNSAIKHVALPDESLALQMQLYSTFSLFADQVISDTKTTFANIFGALSIFFKKIPAKKTIDIILHILDYSFKHLLLSILPATLEPIELELPKTELENSEITNGVINIRANNIPAPVTITDIVDNVLFILGISGGGEKAKVWINTLEEALQEATLIFTNELNDALKNQSDIDYDADLFTIIPQIHFEATGYTRELYTLYPLPGGIASTLITPMSDTLEWKASAENRGKATVSLQTAPGAFGNAMAGSNQVTVTVGPIALVVQKLATIPEGESEPIAVKLSKSPPKNQEIVVNATRSSGDESISVTSLNPLIFNESNWDDYQFFVVTAKEDADRINGVAYITVSADNMEDETTIVSERDNDIINIETNEDTFSIIEGVSKYTGLKVKLNLEPSFPITVTIAHEDGDEDITIESGSVLYFDDSNWDTFQTVTLAASQDSDLDSGVAIFKISADDSDIKDIFVSVIEIEPYEYALAIEATSWRDLPSQNNRYLYDEIIGIVPLTKECGINGVGTVKGSATLDYNGFGSEMPYYDYEKDEFVVCKIDIIGVAHVSVEADNFICAEYPSLSLNLNVKTDYMFINTCPSQISSTPNVDEYDGIIKLNQQNNYQYELNEDWEEGDAHGNDYFFAEIIESTSP